MKQAMWSIKKEDLVIVKQASLFRQLLGEETPY